MIPKYTLPEHTFSNKTSPFDYSVCNLNKLTLKAMHEFSDTKKAIEEEGKSTLVVGFA